MNTPWKPNVTVAALIEHAGRFLLVEEETDDGIRYNQPAGHLDEGESLVAACVRETLEETAWHFKPTALVGIYQWRRTGGDSLAAGQPQGEAVKDCDPERNEGEPPSPSSMGRGMGGRSSTTSARSRSPRRS